MNQNEPKGKQREPKRTKVRLLQQRDSDDVSMSGYGARDQQQAGYFQLGLRVKLESWRLRDCILCVICVGYPRWSFVGCDCACVTWGRTGSRLHLSSVFFCKLCAMIELGCVRQNNMCVDIRLATAGSGKYPCLEIDARHSHELTDYCEAGNRQNGGNRHDLICCVLIFVTVLIFLLLDFRAGGTSLAAVV